MQARIARFVLHEKFAVVGASADRAKIGNEVLRRYVALNKSVVPINPKTYLILATNLNSTNHF